MTPLTFVIANCGRKSLEIKDVHADCACTATHYDRTISPGSPGSMTLSIKPFSNGGEYSKGGAAISALNHHKT